MRFISEMHCFGEARRALIDSKQPQHNNQRRGTAIEPEQKGLTVQRAYQRLPMHSGLSLRRVPSGLSANQEVSGSTVRRSPDMRRLLATDWPVAAGAFVGSNLPTRRHYCLSGGNSLFRLDAILIIQRN
jgi:hypothetical protein